jgi:hypothetical protein
MEILDAVVRAASHYHDIKSGRVPPIDGEHAFAVCAKRARTPCMSEFVLHADALTDLIEV